MAEGEGVDVGVGAVVGCAVVEEAADLLLAAGRVDYECKAVEFADRVDGGGADCGCAGGGVPQGEVTGGAVGAAGAEGEGGGEGGEGKGGFGPECAAFVVAVGGREDDFVGEELRDVAFAEDGPPGDAEGVGRDAAFVAEGEFFEDFLREGCEGEEEGEWYYAHVGGGCACGFLGVGQ